MPFVISPPPPSYLAVHGRHGHFPVHRIYCVGRNYADHAQEMGCTGREAPFFFMKPADAVLHTPNGETVDMPYPPLTQELHYEVELVVALGTGGHDIDPARALSHIWGYAVGLDMTRRDLQAEMKKHGRPWCIAKGFDHSAPIGPVVPLAQTADMQQADIRLYVNGQERQSGNTRQMIWNLAETIAHLSRAWTLQPGDLIMTGTPAGVGAVKPGDLLTATIDSLPPLNVRVC